MQAELNQPLTGKPQTVFEFNFHWNQFHGLWPSTVTSMISRPHSFPQKILTNSAHHLVNSAAHHGNTDEIPQLDQIMNRQVKYIIDW